MHKFCKENIQYLTVEILHSHSNETIIPDLVTTIQREQKNSEFNEDDLKREYGLKPLTVSTVNSWMNKLVINMDQEKNLR